MQKIYSHSILFALLSLFFLLPFHAFGVTFLNAIFFDPATPAPAFLKMWKEVLIVLIGVVSIGFVGAYCIRQKHHSLAGVCNTPLRVKHILHNFLKNLDGIDWLIIGFSLLGIFLSLFQKFSGEFSFSTFLYGIKYTLFPLWIFFVFRRISSFFPEITDRFFKIFWRVFSVFAGLIVFSGVGLFIVAQSTPEVFAILGYSTDHSFHSLFQPLAYCQKVSFTEICRAQGVFSGPNQLGAYLIFLLLLLISFILERMQNIYIFHASVENKTKELGDHKGTPLQKFFYFSLLFSGIFLLIFTFSRSAWIGAFFAGIFFLFFLPEISRKIKKIILSGMFLLSFLGVLVFSLFAPDLSDKIINRVSSSSEHLELSKQGVAYITENPFGSGLGTAGAASKYESEEGQKEIGFIPENWYLQIGIETGVLGVLLWLGIVFLVIQKLVFVGAYCIRPLANRVSGVCNTPLQEYLPGVALVLASSIFGISIMGLFLHSWESSAVAYTVWGLAGIILRK